MRTDNQYPAFKLALVAAVEAEIKRCRKVGTTGMSLDNLRMVVTPPSTALWGAPCGANAQWAYAEMFKDVCASNPAAKRFIITR